MDYLQIYKEEFDRTFEVIKLNTIDEFKSAREQGRNFNDFYSDMNGNLSERQYKISKDFEERNLKNCLKLFDKRRGLYFKKLSDDEVISKVFEKEIQNEFLKHNYSNYDQFIKEIAKYQSYENITNHFHNHHEYYELLYIHNMYEYFYAKDFKNNDYKSSDEYKEMHILEYGKNKIEEIQSHEVKPKKTKEELNKEEQKTIYKINKFTVKEKYLILAVLHNAIGTNSNDEYVYKKLPIGELLRIISITKDVINYDTFYKDLNEISIYTELRKKHSLINRNEYDYYIDQLNNKMQDLKLPKFQKYLQEFLKFSKSS